MRDIAAFGDWE